MNTSYDDTTGGIVPVVEAFSYNDTFGLQASSDMPLTGLEEPAGGVAANADSASGITKEEMACFISEARAEGVAQGLSQAAARFEEGLAQERKRLAALIVDFQRQRAEYYSRVEIELVHLALAIAAKILHRESQVDRMVVAGLVKVILERFQQNSKVTVRVRPEDVEGWTQYFSDHTNLQVVGDNSLEPRGCLLETELGVANMALDAQLKEVEQGFFDLLAQRPEPK